MVDGNNPPNFPTLYDLASSGVFQLDVPHVLGHSMNALDERRANVTCGDDSLECDALQFYGTWYSALECRDDSPEENSDPYESVSIDFVMLCPRPHWFNTGPHRAMMGLKTRDEYVVMAVEESESESNNIQIGVVPRGDNGQDIISKSEAIDIFEAAVYAATGFLINPTSSPISEVDFTDGNDLLASGCTPTSSMGEY